MAPPLELALIGEVSPDLFDLFGQLGAAGATVHLGAPPSHRGPLVMPVSADPTAALAAFRSARARYADLPLVVLGDLDVRTALTLMREGGVQVVLREEGGAGVMRAASLLAVASAVIAPRAAAATSAPMSAAPVSGVGPLVKASLGQRATLVGAPAKQARAEFPPVGDTIAQVERLRAQVNVGVADLEKVIPHDPALLAAVIRASNSAQYRSPRMVTNVKDAIVRMGIQPVLSVMVAHSVARGLRVANPRGQALLQALWKNATLTADLARCLAESEQLPRPEELYVSALLHNLGEMVLVWRHFEDGGGDSPEAMQELAFHVADEHESVGMTTATSWGLPPLVQNMAGYHHTVRPHEPPSDTIARHVVRACWGLAREVLGDDLDGQEPVEPNVELDALGVSQATRTRLARHCAAILSGTA
jgi:HD-like signal output (HDOD) protein